MNPVKDELLAALFAALDKFREELGSDVSAARIQTLLAVALNPGMHQTNLENYVKGMSQQGLSRNVLDLSERTTSQNLGPDLVRSMPDPAYRRRNVLIPTPAATKLLNSVVADMSRGMRNHAKTN